VRYSLAILLRVLTSTATRLTTRPIMPPQRPRLPSNLIRRLRACLPNPSAVLSTSLAASPNSTLRNRKIHTKFRWMTVSKMAPATCIPAGTAAPPPPPSQNPQPKALALSPALELGLVLRKMGKLLKLPLCFVHHHCFRFPTTQSTATGHHCTMYPLPKVARVVYSPGGATVCNAPLVPASAELWELVTEVATSP
jgi:hypothetical protein